MPEPKDSWPEHFAPRCPLPSSSAARENRLRSLIAGAQKTLSIWKQALAFLRGIGWLTRVGNHACMQLECRLWAPGTLPEPLTDPVGYLFEAQPASSENLTCCKLPSGRGEAPSLGFLPGQVWGSLGLDSRSLVTHANGQTVGPHRVTGNHHGSSSRHRPRPAGFGSYRCIGHHYHERRGA